MSNLKLNLGCGTDIRSGFVNIDIRNLPGIDLVCDVRDLQFLDGTSKFIVAQHLLEYIPRPDLQTLLKKCAGWLAPEGLLEIRVTDINALCKASHLNSISSEMGLGHEMVIALLYGSQRHEHDIRYNGFTAEYLEGILTSSDLTLKNITREEFDIILTCSRKHQ